MFTLFGLFALYIVGVVASYFSGCVILSVGGGVDDGYSAEEMQGINVMSIAWPLVLVVLPFFLLLFFGFNLITPYWHTGVAFVAKHVKILLGMNNG